MKASRKRKQQHRQRKKARAARRREAHAVANRLLGIMPELSVPVLWGPHAARIADTVFGGIVGSRRSGKTYFFTP